MFLASYYIFKNTLESSLLWFWYLPISFCPKKTNVFFLDVLILWAFGGDPSLENSTGIILGWRFFWLGFPRALKKLFKILVVSGHDLHFWEVRQAKSVFPCQVWNHPQITVGTSARNFFEVWVLVLSLFWEGGPGVSNLYRNHYGLHST